MSVYLWFPNPESTNHRPYTLFTIHSWLNSRCWSANTELTMGLEDPFDFGPKTNSLQIPTDDSINLFFKNCNVYLQWNFDINVISSSKNRNRINSMCSFCLHSWKRDRAWCIVEVKVKLWRWSSAPLPGRRRGWLGQLEFRGKESPEQEEEWVGEALELHFCLLLIF